MGASVGRGDEDCVESHALDLERQAKGPRRVLGRDVMEQALALVLGHAREHLGMWNGYMMRTGRRQMTSMPPWRTKLCAINSAAHLLTP